MTKTGQRTGKKKAREINILRGEKLHDIFFKKDITLQNHWGQVLRVIREISGFWFFQLSLFHVQIDNRIKMKI